MKELKAILNNNTKPIKAQLMSLSEIKEKLKVNASIFCESYFNNRNSLDYRTDFEEYKIYFESILNWFGLFCECNSNDNSIVITDCKDNVFLSIKLKDVDKILNK